MPYRRVILFSSIMLLGASAPKAQAQPPIVKPFVAPKSDRSEIPRDFRPPPGMCRIWIDNVPSGQQPAPTDCASAIRNRPPNGRVIFSDSSAGRTKPRENEKAPERKPKKPPESS